MNNLDYELLSQYLDRELSPADHQAVDLRLNEDPEFAAALEEITLANQRWVAELSSPAKNVVPDHIKALIKHSNSTSDTRSTVLEFPQRKQAAQSIGAGKGWQKMAIAASIMAVAALTVLDHTNDSSPLNPTLSSNLNSAKSVALDSVSSGSEWQSLSDNTEFKAVLSFQHQDGRWCREYFTRQSDEFMHAVACRGADSNWTDVATAELAHYESSNEYRQAGAADDTAISDFVEAHATDIALGLEQEQVQIRSNWAQ